MNLKGLVAFHGRLILPFKLIFTSLCAFLFSFTVIGKIYAEIYTDFLSRIVQGGGLNLTKRIENFYRNPFYISYGYKIPFKNKYRLKNRTYICICSIHLQNVQQQKNNKTQSDSSKTP